MRIFKSADILIPEERYLERWAVIACDQFSSQPGYWERTRNFVSGHPSAYNIIFPEAELGRAEEERTASINSAMLSYLESGIFKEYKGSYVYVERRLSNGKLRRGLVGMIDLEAYDYSPSSVSLVRATEKTVTERLPARVRIRENAAIETSHVILLCDDAEGELLNFEPGGESIYEFDLMQGGGHISGRLITGGAASRFEKRLNRYISEAEERYAVLGLPPLIFAAGDGNHSLAAAKDWWERLKSEQPGLAGTEHPARYAMVELENIHDESQDFEPIHRLVEGISPEDLLSRMGSISSEGGIPVRWNSAGKSGVLHIDPAGADFPIFTLQSFLDEYGKGEMDYIHGAAAAKELSQGEDSIAFLLPPIDKDGFFARVAGSGILPRKTFSIGTALDKRYYIECRRIR